MIYLFNILFLALSLFSNFEQSLKKYLDDKLSNYDSYEFEIMKTKLELSKVIIDESKEFIVSKNFVYVPVKIKTAENNFENALITLKVKLYKNVFIAKKSFYSGELLTEEFLEKKLADVTLINGTPFQVLDNIQEYKLKNNLKKNSILLYEHVKKIPLINKGDKIILHAGNNNVDITIEAISRQDGYEGDIISVQSMNKIYKAKVIDKINLVLVN